MQFLALQFFVSFFSNEPVSLSSPGTTLPPIYLSQGNWGRKKVEGVYRGRQLKRWFPEFTQTATVSLCLRAVPCKRKYNEPLLTHRQSTEGGVKESTSATPFQKGMHICHCKSDNLLAACAVLSTPSLEASEYRLPILRFRWTKTFYKAPLVLRLSAIPLTLKDKRTQDCDYYTV